MKVVKRDASLADFDKRKIETAILKSMKNGSGIVKPDIAAKIADEIEAECSESGEDEIDISDIEAKVFDKLISKRQRLTARSYEGYRSVREFQRDCKNTTDQPIQELLNGTNKYLNDENSNKNSRLLTTQRDYMAGIISTDLTRRFLLSPEIVQAHDDGIAHYHDADYNGMNAITNCSLINLDDMLQNGTCINKVKIEKPHRLLTAMTIATQIITAVTSSQYGGATITLTHLAPFVRESRKRFFEKYVNRGMFTKDIDKFVEQDLREEIAAAVQTFNYQCNSMTTTNGQSPFLSVFMYLGETDEYKEELAMLIEEFLRQRIKGMKNEAGVYVTQAFPKLLYVLEEDNIHEDSKYYYLTKLAAECSAKRLVPDYISEKVMKELKDGNCYPCMGCRSFLTVYHDENNKPKFYGRFNQGVVTINLVDVACSSGKDKDRFWKIFDERLELCHRALMCRHNRLKGTPSDVAPILWQYGALARLKKGETIDKLLYNGYSTISLGYAGLCECVKYMTGTSHTDPQATPFALEIMQHMNDACAKWKAEHNIDFSLYGTPLESTTYKFAKCLQKRFGLIPGITDKNYITNSYHVHVTEKINAFDKLKFESQFQKLSPGGAISYVEVPNMQNNIDAVLSVMKYIYENIMYAELNTKSDYCMACGYDGEIQIEKDENGKLIWECPNCGNRNQDKMNVARRTCGYIGTQFWNQGRTQEIKERVLHL